MQLLNYSGRRTYRILRNFLASDNLENIKFVENISDLISYGALRKVLG